ESYATCRTYQEVAEAIRSMVVRGAPAIGVAAAMGVALGVRDSSARNSQELRLEFEEITRMLAATRPTAVNLFWALERMRGKFEALQNQNLGDIKQALIEEAQRMHAEDIAANIAMGRHGAALMPARGGVLTHCNAGALATCGYGTALGVIRSAVEQGKKLNVYADETRPFLQGSRLTAWELNKDGIATTVISDSMAGERVAPEGVEVENPAFDVTPHRYVTAIITERGVALPPLAESLKRLAKISAEQSVAAVER